MAKKSKVVIPDYILQCWKEYEGTELPEPIAIRTDEGYFAVLFRVETEHERKIAGGSDFYAIDFNNLGDGWEVSNDFIDFDTIEEFETEKLTKTIL